RSGVYSQSPELGDWLLLVKILFLLRCCLPALLHRWPRLAVPQRFIHFPRYPQPMQQNRQLPRHRDAHLIGVAAGQPLPRRLRQPARCIHQHGSRLPPGCAHPDDPQVPLCLLTTVLVFRFSSNRGSTRARRASVCASIRSFFRLLLLINCTCRALATITSCPKLFSSRLTHGEWVPTSIATRHGFMLAKTCPIVFLVVATLASSDTSPFSSNMQCRLVLSPKSIPTVTFVALVALTLAFGLLQPLLFFFMVGLLLHFECVLGA